MDNYQRTKERKKSFDCTAFVNKWVAIHTVHTLCVKIASQARRRKEWTDTTARKCMKRISLELQQILQTADGSWQHDFKKVWLFSTCGKTFTYTVCWLHIGQANESCLETLRKRALKAIFTFTRLNMFFVKWCISNPLLSESNMVIRNSEPFPRTKKPVYLINSEQIGISEQFFDDQKVP